MEDGISYTASPHMFRNASTEELGGQSMIWDEFEFHIGYVGLNSCNHDP